MNQDITSDGYSKYEFEEEMDIVEDGEYHEEEQEQLHIHHKHGGNQGKFNLLPADKDYWKKGRQGAMVTLTSKSG
eukprot:6868751-Ditylum_brightwellii.AAC.1